MRCAQGPNGIKFSALWYKIPGINDFWICSYCFQHDLAHTEFAGIFESFQDQPLPGTKNVCDFNSVQAKDLVQVARRTSNFQPVAEFAERRSALPSCSGTRRIFGGAGVLWYSSPDISNFVSCGACQRDFLDATPFGHRFQPCATQAMPHEGWFCDLAITFIKRKLLQCAKQNDWRDFVNACMYRMSLPSCSTLPVYQNSRRWFIPVRPTPLHSMLTCEACFLDYVGSSPIANNFAEYQPAPEEGLRQIVCSFQLSAIRNLNWLSEEDHQLPVAKYQSWHYQAGKIITSPPCVAAGITGTNWYTFQDPDNPSQPVNSDFDICEGCFLAYGEAAGLTRIFRPQYYARGTTRACDFCSSGSRYDKYMAKWTQAVMICNPRALLDYVRLIAGIEVCPRSTTVANRMWWGTDNYFFCHECYLEIGRNTALESHFTYAGHSFPSACCDMYTDNMRQRYLVACQTGRTGLDDFLAYTIKRAEVHDKYRAYQQQRSEVQEAVKNTNVINAMAGGVGVTMAVKGSGVGSMDWISAQNRMMQGQTNAMLLRRVANQKSQEEIEVEYQWRQME